MQVSELISRYFPMKPTRQQQEAFGAIGEFLSSHDPTRCFILRGYAGTGKTTMISTLVKALPSLKLRSVLLAPTGRAAKVMGSYSGRQAMTIHKKIYRKKVALSPEMSFGRADNMHKDTLFIVDEASMISNERVSFSSSGLLDDLIQYVHEGENCFLMFVGDTAQLPPVGLPESPALEPTFLSATFGIKVFHYEMTMVVRQQQESGILYNATRIRELIQHHNPQSATPEFPKIRTAGFSDVFQMTGERLIEGLHYAYDKYGIANCLVVCRSNKHANLYNQHIRNTILFREEELTGGDYIMVVRNNYYWLAQDAGREGFIANGDMAQIRRVRNVHEQYGFRFADISIEFLDSEEIEPLACRVILDSLHSESPSLSPSDQNLLYEAVMEDYSHIPDKKGRIAALKADPYYNALQIKFSMAVTCHKAQGGQWEAVFVDQGYLTDEMLNLEFLRWLYTACTRATKEFFFVNFSKKFF